MPKDNLQAPRVSTGMRCKLIAWHVHSPRRWMVQKPEASKMEDVRSVELEDTRWLWGRLKAKVRHFARPTLVSGSALKGEYIYQTAWPHSLMKHLPAYAFKVRCLIGRRPVLHRPLPRLALGVWDNKNSGRRFLWLMLGASEVIRSWLGP